MNTKLLKGTARVITPKSQAVNGLHKKPKTRASTTMTSKDKIAEMEDQIKRLEAKLAKTKREYTLLTGAMTSSSQRRDLFSDFQSTLDQFSYKLQERSNRLKMYEENVNTFRQEDHEEKDLLNLRGIQFSNKENQQTELIRENTKLVSQALAQERILLILKMRLRLCHDHRDFDELRSVLNKLMGGGKDLDEDQIIVKKYKSIINTIKQHKHEEKRRIQELQQPYNIEKEAAIIIQKTFRGKLERQRLQREKAEQAANAKENSSKPSTAGTNK